jgi:hypothetical protein
LNVTKKMFKERYADVFKGDAEWRKIAVPTGETYAWDNGSTYVQNPPYFEHMGKTPAPVTDILGARVLGLFLDSITTDHISPAGSIKAASPAGQYLIANHVEPLDFNQYGTRRGNHEVMMRGTFANIRIKNQMLGGKEGGLTIHYPDATEMPIYDAAMKYRAEGVPLVVFAGKEYGTGLVARLGGQGHAPPRRPRRDRRELRAHPPLEPHRHGRSAAGLQGRNHLEVARPRRQRGGHHRRHLVRPSSGPDARGGDSPRLGRDQAGAAHLPDRYPRRARILQQWRHSPLRAPPSCGIVAEGREFHPNVTRK